MYNAHKIEIPKEFQRETKAGCFTHCSACNKELIESNALYMIEKAYSKNIQTNKIELVFEYAICVDCIQEVHSQISEESKKNMESYFSVAEAIEHRNRELTKYELYETDIWLQNCIVTNESIDNLDEYQIYAMCQGGKMPFYFTPYMVSGKAVDKVVDLLSNETLDVLNGFWDKLDNPVRGEKIPKRRPVFF